MSPEIWIAIITGVGGILLGLYNAIVSARKGVVDELRAVIAEVKGLYETEKVKREELERKLELLEAELVERDEVITDLQRWATQLVGQLRVHAPDVKPAEFVRSRKV